MSNAPTASPSCEGLAPEDPRIRRLSPSELLSLRGGQCVEFVETLIAPLPLRLRSVALLQQR